MQSARFEFNMESAMKFMGKEATDTLHYRFSHLNEVQQKYRNCAAVTMVKNDDYKNCSVIVACTGDRILPNEALLHSRNGLLDFHAEVLARRSLVYYLYNQLMFTFERGVDNENSIFELHKKSSKYVLKQSVKFYLFVHLTPCGDSKACSNSTDKTKGLLRMKLDSEGDVDTYLTSMYRVANQDLRDITIGDPLLIMSCADKILKWNVLGVQGSILLQLIAEPIYFSAIGINGDFDVTQCERAFYKRIDNKNLQLNYPFRLNRMQIFETSFGKSSPVSSHVCLNWILGQVGVEVVSVETGLQLNNPSTPSRLCKLSMFNLFLNLCPLFCTSEQSIPSSISFDELKNLHWPYKKMKMEFLRAVQACGLNHWILHSIDLNI